MTPSTPKTRQTIKPWTPEPLEYIPNCLDASLKRAVGALCATEHPGDAIDASRLEYLRLSLAAQPLAVAAPIHWRAVLDPEQQPRQPKESLHVVGFRRERAAESWIAEQLDFGGWRYALEPLYAAPQPPAGQQDRGEAKFRVATWGNCPACHHDRIPGEACARKDCPDRPATAGEATAAQGAKS